MPRQINIKDHYFENRLFLNRIVAAFVFIILLCFGLISRLIYLQIGGHEHYTTLSKNNRIKIAPLPPTRGLIYDRNGRILAENITTYSLEIIPEQVDNLEKTLTELQVLLEITDEEIEHFHSLRKRHKRFASTPLRLHLNDIELARFAARRPRFPGVDIHARLVRNYPFAELTSHIVGYVGRINVDELKNLDAAVYRGTHHIGKTGIEKTYETSLHGKSGYEEIETNAQGRYIDKIGNVAPLPGTNLHLTLDIDLQRIAQDELNDHNGAVVAIEPDTGNVLVMVSKPGFDPNPFVYGIRRKDYNALQTSPDRPLFNRALRGKYPPGSTIKPFIGLAGLENNVATMSQQTYCPGYYQLPKVSHRYRDWKKWGHGSINLKAAITQSCDVYFYDLAHNLGIDRLSKFLGQFGFGDKTYIDLTGEKSGLLPSRAWKRRARNQPWYPGETLITGIGQGFFQITPLQLAKATAVMANRGKMVQPHLVDYMEPYTLLPKLKSHPGTDIPLSPTNVTNIIDAMVNVVHGPRGTARRISKDIDYQIAGKTGTAQVFTVKQEESYKEDEVDKKLRDHALFIAFAPAQKPQIAIAVVVENGGHGGSVAAPIAGKVIKQYLTDKF